MQNSAFFLQTVIIEFCQENAMLSKSPLKMQYDSHPSSRQISHFWHVRHFQKLAHKFITKRRIHQSTSPPNRIASNYLQHEADTKKMPNIKTAPKPQTHVS